MRRATGQCGHAKAAGVAIAIEHPLRLQALHILGKALAAVALVQVIARLMPLRDVQAQLPAVFAQHQGHLALAAQPTHAGVQAF